jgi:hypothetical protein
MEKHFPRDVQVLREVFDFVGEFCATHDVPDGNVASIQLIVEELLTNMIKYNRKGTRDISVRLTRREDILEIQVTDFDVHDFDVTPAPEVDVTRPVSSRARSSSISLSSSTSPARASASSSRLSSVSRAHTLRVVDPSPHVRNIFHYAGLDKILGIA